MSLLLVSQCQNRSWMKASTWFFSWCLQGPTTMSVHVNTWWISVKQILIEFSNSLSSLLWISSSFIEFSTLHFNLIWPEQKYYNEEEDNAILMGLGHGHFHLLNHHANETGFKTIDDKVPPSQNQCFPRVARVCTSVPLRWPVYTDCPALSPSFEQQNRFGHSLPHHDPETATSLNNNLITSRCYVIGSVSSLSLCSTWLLMEMGCVSRSGPYMTLWMFSADGSAINGSALWLTGETICFTRTHWCTMCICTCPTRLWETLRQDS